MGSKAKILLALIAALVGIALLVIIILILLAFIGVSPLGTGCFIRYSRDGEMQSQSSINLMASGNYTTNVSSSGVLSIDPNAYGKWKNTGWIVKENEVVNLEASGEVQLCKAYLPLKNNLNSTSIPDTRTTKILIPNTDSTDSPIELKFDAKNCQWRNIAQLDFNDHIVVTLRPNAKPIDTSIGNIRAMTYTNPLTGQAEPAVDCSENLTAYSPVCGRWASEVSAYYISQCTQDADPCPNSKYSTNGSWSTTPKPILKPYKDDGSATYSHSTMLSNFVINRRFNNIYITNDPKFTTPPETAKSICDGGLVSDTNAIIKLSDASCNVDNRGYSNYQHAPVGVAELTLTSATKSCIYCAVGSNRKFFEYNYDYNGYAPSGLQSWYSADTATGLLYRFSDTDNSVKPIDSERGNPESSDRPGYRFASILEGRKIFKYTHLDGTKYLQFRPISDKCNTNTGGYIVGIKQTKCRRSNGGFSTDSFANRGQIQYIITDFEKDPNTTTFTPSSLTFTKGATTFTANKNGKLWLKINNNPNDVIDSSGQYTITKNVSAAESKFNDKVLTPMLTEIKNMSTSTGTKIFQNMTCYQNTEAPCTNFFTYIKAMLTLYVAVFGAMFLLGMVQISQKDLVIRIIKIAIISGLISGQTFVLFQTYVFDFTINFSNQIISNISGYSLPTVGAPNNPLMFTDELLSRMFFSPTFLAQLLATLSFGIFGPFYFILILIALVICVITIFRAIAVYIMAFIAVALLLGLAPFFLVFMLFQQTYYLFENWSRFLFRYMIEPAILLVGIIILTKLFTIYLDNVLGYSVCWKCALEFKLPFPSIPGLPTGILNTPLFCISWFGAWGLDSSNNTIGMNMSNIVGLIMIAYCMYGYTDFAGSLVTNLTNTPLAPGATGMGKSISSAMGQAALGKVGLDSANRNRQINQAEGNFNSKMKSAKGDE
jgi:type IV secretion system protein VirB6